ncbi:MAG: zeta toxin family protein [Opitutales bacterium]|nr:zeta toxin family protein [Opitutales bacterium]
MGKKTKKHPQLYVLAGVNGAGKSSIGERIFNAQGSVVYNPDTIARKILALHPAISPALANGYAWQIGKSLLEQALREGKDYLFETTLGGRTIPRLLLDAARSGHRLHLWFCGLESPELHLRRVRARVAGGGHDIPEEKIRERWDGSRRNLIRLLPVIHHLRVYDNSAEADPALGKAPRPVLLLEMKNRKITAPADLSGAPEWAQAIIAAAIKIHTLPA